MTATLKEMAEREAAKAVPHCPQCYGETPCRRGAGRLECEYCDNTLGHVQSAIIRVAEEHALRCSNAEFDRAMRLTDESNAKLRAELEAARGELSRMVEPAKHHAVCGQLDAAKAEIEQRKTDYANSLKVVDNTWRYQLAEAKAEIETMKLERAAGLTAMDAQEREIKRLRAEIDEDNQHLADYSESFTNQLDANNNLRGVCREVAAELLEIGDIERSRTGGGARI